MISECVCVWAGPEAKKMKKGEFKPAVKKTTKEELKRNRQQRKKEVKKQRQQTERKDMFDIICQAKKVWGSLRRYTRTHTHRNHGGGGPPSPAGAAVQQVFPSYRETTAFTGTLVALVTALVQLVRQPGLDTPA